VREVVERLLVLVSLLEAVLVPCACRIGRLRDCQAHPRGAVRTGVAQYTYRKTIGYRVIGSDCIGAGQPGGSAIAEKCVITDDWAEGSAGLAEDAERLVHRDYDVVWP